MEDSKPEFRVEVDREQKENLQLKVAAWALCKESNVASGKNVVSSLSAVLQAEKWLQSEELKIKDVQKTLGSPCKEHSASVEEQNGVPSLCEKELESEEKEVHYVVLASGSAEGLKRKPIVWCEEQDKVKSEKKLMNSLDEVVALKLEHKSVHEDLKVKKEFELGDLNDEDIEEENDAMDMNRGANAEHVQNIIAGRSNISFNQFKRLMEDGHLKKGDLAMVRNARVVQVPGKGEVVQFMQTKQKDFNKINLKEVGLNDLGVRPFTWKKRFLAQTQLPSLISELISKKGSTFRCNTCKTTHPVVASVQSHISINHADILVKSEKYTSNGNRVKCAIAMLLKKMCDPSLIIEQVVIINQGLKHSQTKKKKKSNNQGNVFPSRTAADPVSAFLSRKAAGLLTALIHPVQAGPEEEGQLVYHCKSCGVNTSSSNWRKNDRWGCVWHLAYAHTDDYQDLAARLNVAPGPGLDNLLFQALAPGLIYNAKKPY